MTNKHHVLTHRHLILKDKQCILRFAHQGIIYSHHITVRLMLRQLWRSIYIPNRICIYGWHQSIKFVYWWMFCIYKGMGYNKRCAYFRPSNSVSLTQNINKPLSRHSPPNLWTQSALTHIRRRVTRCLIQCKAVWNSYIFTHTRLIIWLLFVYWRLLIQLESRSDDE